MNSTNPIVANAIAAINGKLYHGDSDALAEKICQAFNKWYDHGCVKDDAWFGKLNTLMRTADSMAGGVWAMRDGSIVVRGDRPRGGERLADTVKRLVK